MPYQTATGRVTRGLDVSALQPTTTQTVSTNGSSLELGDRDQIRLTIATTAVSGTTPSMTVNVQTSNDNATWATVGSFTAITTVTSAYKLFTGIDRFVRLTTTITGTTPSFTWSVTSGEAV